MEVASGYTTAGQGGDEEALRLLLDRLSTRSGAHFEARELDVVRRRLRAVAQRFELGGIRPLSEAFLSKRRPDIEQAVLDAITVNYTYFNREPEVLQTFIQDVLPGIWDREPEVRIWCAASSSGQEPYSLVMHMADKMGLEAVAQRVRILGTDINQEVLQVAERAEYRHAALDSLPAEWKRQYTRSNGANSATICEPLRQICIFRKLNLMKEPWPFKRRMHAVFCRNVLYYFAAPSREVVLRRIHEVTAPEGWLITSLTEPLGRQQPYWLEKMPAVHQRRDYVPTAAGRHLD